VVQPNGTSWDRLEYVGQVGQGQGGLQIFVGQVGQGQGGLQIRWDMDSGQVSVHLNQSTCPKVGLQGHGLFTVRYREI